MHAEGVGRLRQAAGALTEHAGDETLLELVHRIVELHAFVDADSQKSVQRLYWVQFEGYLPTRPELEHTYDSPRHANLGGLDFYVDTWVRLKDAETQPGSDVEHIMALIRAKGYQMPSGMMYVRLVHLLDEQKRKELMIIYGEDVAQSALTAGELQPGGKAHDRWPSIAEGLLERAVNQGPALAFCEKRQSFRFR